MGETFSAWLPNATANISFSQIGDSSSRTAAGCYNKIATGGDHFFAVDERTSTDGPFFPIINRLLFSRTAKVIYAVQAKVVAAKIARPHFDEHGNLGVPDFVEDSKGALEGQILAVGHSPKAPIFLPQGLRAELRNVRSKFRSQLNIVEFERYKGSFDWIDELVARKENLNDEAPTFKVWFRLNRLGECQLKIQDYCTGGVGDEDGDGATKLEAANQAFFVLRDLVHRHYHHDPKADKTSVAFDATDDAHWRRETEYNLMRMALRARRKDNIAHYKNAMGILAYAQNFQKHLSYWYYKPDTTGTLIPTLRQDASRLDLESLTSSMEASLRSLEWNNQTLSVALGMALATYFGIISAIGVAFSVGPDNLCEANCLNHIESGKWFYGSLEFFARNPLYIFIPPLLTFFIAMFFAHPYSFVNAPPYWIARLRFALLGQYRNAFAHFIINWGFVLFTLAAMTVFALWFFFSLGQLNKVLP